jgi:hypothetical protein
MIFDICHMDMLSVYGVLCLHNCCLEWLWIESFKNVVLSSLSLQEPYLLLMNISFLLKRHKFKVSEHSRLFQVPRT